MTIYGTLMSGLRKRSNYAGNWIRPAGKAPKQLRTRQGIRHATVRVWFERVSRDNRGLPRSERRKLARAYAVGDWYRQLAKAKGASA